MKNIILDQMDVRAGNPEANQKRILTGISRAKDSGWSLVVFPELALPGYLLGDEWENETFVRECVEMNDEIIRATEGIAAIWGNVAIDDALRNEDGRIRKYNAAYVAQNGVLVPGEAFDGFTVKSLMPKYREFDDERHFHSLQKLAAERNVRPESLLRPFEIVIDGVRRRIGVIICEDMWDDDYAFKPVSVLKAQGIDAIVNVSASPYGIGKAGKRDRLLKEHSKGTSFYYANNVGAQNNGKNVFLFDGGSSVYREGEKIASANAFEDGAICENDVRSIGTLETIEEIEKGLVMGIRTFLESVGKKKIVIGLSWGVDSAVVAALAVQALGSENVVAVNMPSKFNSETTKSLAAKLAENLGIRYLEAPIEASVKATKDQLEALLGMPMEGLNAENAQARDRGSRLLAGIASMTDSVFTNNGNKTEIALGYATLYGDVNGALAPIADLYKTQVYALARRLNATMGDVIPEGILDLKPSAELSNDQNVDEGKGDPFDYPVTDAILYQLIELRRDPGDILEECLVGAESGLGKNFFETNFKSPAALASELEHLWKLYKNSYFKRVQAPPILSVSKRAFGFDLREAQNGVRFSKKFLEMKKIVETR